MLPDAGFTFPIPTRSTSQLYTNLETQLANRMRFAPCDILSDQATQSQLEYQGCMLSQIG